MRKGTIEGSERLKKREGGRVEVAGLLGFISALLTFGISSLVGLFDGLSKAGAFVSVSALIVTLLCFHAFWSFLWAFGMHLSHNQLRMLGKVLLAIDGGMSLILVCYAYLLFVIMIGFIADRNFPAVWMVAGMNIAFFAILIALRNLIGKRIKRWFRVEIPQFDFSES